MLYKTVLVAFDGSPGSWSALRKAIRLAKEQGSGVRLLSVAERMPHYAATIDEVDEEREQQLAYFARVQVETATLAQEEGVDLEAATIPGHAAESIVAYAARIGADLIVLGHSGHGGSLGSLLGSTTDRVVDHARCDVLIVRQLEATRGVSPHQVESFGASYQVGDVMTANVVRVSPEAPLGEAAELMVRSSYRALPVVDRNGRVVGILTNSDLVERGGLGMRVELLRALPPEQLAGELTRLEEGKVVGDVMSRDVVTVQPGATLAEAAHLMVSRHLKRIPVVDQAGMLLGMISRLDLLKTRSAAQPAFESESETHLGQTVGEVMRKDVPTVSRGASLAEVLDAVVSTRLNRALVLDEDGRVIGAVTDAELVRRLSPRDHPSLVQVLMSRLPFVSLSSEQRRELEQTSGKTAEELMVTNVPTVTADTPLGEAIAAMLREKRKILPVVDSAGRLLGAADRADLLRALVASARKG